MADFGAGYQVNSWFRADATLEYRARARIQHIEITLGIQCQRRSVLESVDRGRLPGSALRHLQDLLPCRHKQVARSIHGNALSARPA